MKWITVHRQSVNSNPSHHLRLPAVMKEIHSSLEKFKYVIQCQKEIELSGKCRQ